jgi:hypothetical protein
MIPPEEDRRQGPPLLQAALAYLERGWSIIPIKPGSKKSACLWKPFQTLAANKNRLRTWFAAGKYTGLAVILGKVSGGLVCRDFDTMESYNAWALAHPDLAATLPTVATARGRHVYFVADHLGFQDFGDGEYRGDGHYCLLPPSRHPDGATYKWLIPLPAGPLPRVADVCAAGLLNGGRVTESTESTERNERDREDREDTDGQKSTEDYRSNGVEGDSAPMARAKTPPTSVPIDPDVDQVILEALPTSIGRRNRQVFELARALKGIPRLADAPVDTLEPMVRRWHHCGVARGVIGTEPFEETRLDFLLAWPKVKFPKGAEPMVAVFERAKAGPIPRAAEKYDQPALRLLAALCRELQVASGDKPFYLSCETARRLLGAPYPMYAWRWLWLLVHDGIIAEVEKGDRGKRRASRYRYLAD